MPTSSGPDTAAPDVDATELLDDDGIAPRIIEQCGNGFLHDDRSAHAAGVRDAARVAAGMIRGEVDKTMREWIDVRHHETRTPLAIIRAGIDTLEAHAQRLDAAERQVVLDAVSRQTERLSAMLDHLDVTFEAAGEFTINARPSDLVDLVDAAVADLARTIDDHPVERLLDPGPLTAHVDPEALCRILTVLVQNAVAHTPAGGRITVVVRRRRSGAVIEVIDEGAGIHDDNRAAVFTKGRRLNREQGHAGLGLYLARGLAEAQGLTLTLEESIAERGACFRLLVPPGLVIES